MKNFIKIYILFFLIIKTIYPVDITENSIQNMLNQEESRVLAIWLSYQTKQYHLLQKAVSLLPKTENLEEQKIILRIFELLDYDLANILPNWYVIIDQYINIKKPKEALLKSIRLIRKFKERKLIPSLLKISKHPDFEIRSEVIQTLKLLQNDSIFPTIILYLRSKDELLNIYGLELIKEIQDERLIPILRDLTQHPNTIIRIYALNALSEYEKESHYIIRNHQNEIEEVIASIIKIIGEKKWNQYSYIVQHNISSGSKLIRKASIIAARNLTNFDSYYISKQLLIESDKEIIEEGILTLVEVRKNDPFQSLVFLLNHSDPKIKLLSLKAIQTLKLDYIESLIFFLEKEKNPEIHLEITYTIANLVNSKNYKILLNSQDFLNKNLTKEEKYLLLSSLKNSLQEREFSNFQFSFND